MLRNGAGWRIIAVAPDQPQANRERHRVNRRGPAGQQRRNAMPGLRVATAVSCKTVHRHCGPDPPSPPPLAQSGLKAAISGIFQRKI